MEHNFQKYTRGEVRTLPTNQGFYDFDVSNIKEWAVIYTFVIIPPVFFVSSVW